MERTFFSQCFLQLYPLGGAGILPAWYPVNVKNPSQRIQSQNSKSVFKGVPSIAFLRQLGTFCLCFKLHNTSQLSKENCITVPAVAMLCWSWKSLLRGDNSNTAFGVKLICAWIVWRWTELSWVCLCIVLWFCSYWSMLAFPTAHFHSLSLSLLCFFFPTPGCSVLPFHCATLELAGSLSWLSLAFEHT